MIPSADDLPHHEIGLVQLDLLASGHHDDDALAVLRGLERSRNRHALRLVMRHTRPDPAAAGPLAPVDEAFQLLVQAERTRPDAVADLLARPQVGVWSAHVLRRLRGKVEEENAKDDKAPLWFHIGYLHALASTAGILAGIPFRMSIPLWDGIIVLPDLGSYRVSHLTGWAHAVVRSDGSSFTIDGEEVDGSWRPVRNFRVGTDADAAQIHLDDVDAYRGLEIPTPPEPVPESAAEKWGADLADAWEVLTRHHTARARELAAGLAVIAPRPTSFRFRPHSGSMGDGFGSAVIAAAHDPVQLAVTMVHEFQHSKLNAIDHLVPLTGDDAALDCYAPWRDDPRGTWGLFQGVYAFTAIAEFWHLQRDHSTGVERDLAHFEFALVREQVTDALDTLQDRPALTATGRRFAARVEDRLAALASAPVPPDILAAARMAVADHRAAWRVRHLHVDPGWARDAARRWLSRRPAPRDLPPAPVRPDPGSRGLDAKGVLARIRLCGDAEFAAARALVGGTADEVVDVEAADFALVGGQPPRALALYADELATGSDRAGAWSGYALALRAGKPGPAADALVRRPELVRAVHAEITAATGEPPDVERLSGWLAARG